MASLLDMKLEPTSLKFSHRNSHKVSHFPSCLTDNIYIYAPQMDDICDECLWRLLDLVCVSVQALNSKWRKVSRKLRQRAPVSCADTAHYAHLYARHFRISDADMCEYAHSGPGDVRQLSPCAGDFGARAQLR